MQHYCQCRKERFVLMLHMHTSHCMRHCIGKMISVFGLCYLAGFRTSSSEKGTSSSLVSSISLQWVKARVSSYAKADQLCCSRDIIWILATVRWYREIVTLFQGSASKLVNCITIVQQYVLQIDIWCTYGDAIHLVSCKNTLFDSSANSLTYPPWLL